MDIWLFSYIKEHHKGSAAQHTHGHQDEHQDEQCNEIHTHTEEDTHTEGHRQVEDWKILYVLCDIAIFEDMKIYNKQSRAKLS